MVIALSLLSVILPIYVLLKDFFCEDTYVIDHEKTFSLGYLMYWGFPILMGKFVEYIDADWPEVVSFWYAYFQLVDESNLMYYEIISVSFFISYMLGSYLGRREGGVVKYHEYISDRNPFLIILKLIYFITFVIMMYQLRNMIGTHYDWQSVGAKSQLATLSIGALGLAILYTLNYSRIIKKINALKNSYVALYFVISLGLMSMGGRIYFIAGIVAFCVACSVYISAFNKKWFVLGGFIVIIAMGVIGGLLRSNGDASIGYRILVNILSEPILNSIGLFAYLETYDFSLVEFPKVLISKLLLLIPKGLCDNAKEYLILDNTDTGFILDNTVGGTNSFYSFTINFGVLGSLGVIFLFGYFLAHMKGDRSLLGRTAYALISGFVTFQFFRDDFSISIVKCMIQDSIILPAIYVVVAYFCYYKGCKRDEQI